MLALLWRVCLVARDVGRQPLTLSICNKAEFFLSLFSLFFQLQIFSLTFYSHKSPASVCLCYPVCSLSGPGSDWFLKRVRLLWCVLSSFFWPSQPGEGWEGVLQWVCEWRGLVVPSTLGRMGVFLCVCFDSSGLASRGERGGCMGVCLFSAGRTILDWSGGTNTSDMGLPSLRLNRQLGIASGGVQCSGRGSKCWCDLQPEAKVC